MTDSQDRGHTPAEAPPARSRARRWARRATLALLTLAAAVAAVARPVWNVDLIGEGQQTINAVVTLAETLIDEFAIEDATAASFDNAGAYPCMNPPPWAPNRVRFEGGVGLWVSSDTDVEGLFDFVEANIEALGLRVRDRRAEELMLESRAHTTVSLLVRTPGRGPEMKVSIFFGSRCLPRPAGYRGGSFESRHALIDDWPGLVGFQSGPLSEARLG